MTEDNKKSFIEYYNIQVLDTNKRTTKKRKHRPFVDPNNKEVFQSEVTFETEQLITLTIPESDLDKIIKMEKILFNRDRQSFQRGLFGTLMDQKELEKFYREQHPAVKKAFEQYSLLLHLVSHGNIRDEDKV